MLSLAQSSGNIFCVEWIPSESGPKVLKYKKIKASFDCNTYLDFLDLILSDFNMSSSNDSNALSLSLDIDNVGLASFKYDDKISFKEYTQWYEKEVLGSYIINNYNIYYHKLYDVRNIAMVIYINKKLKENIIKSCIQNNLEIKHLGIDIFSANIAVNQIYKSRKSESYIIWKIDKNNIHYITCFEDKNLKHYIKIRISKNVNILQSIGSEEVENKLILYIESLIFSKTPLQSPFGNIYIYQTKSDYSFIKKIANKNKKFIIMDIGSYFLNKNKKNINYSLIGYNENGNSLKGIDV